MTLLVHLSALVLLADPSGGAWREAAKDEGITVYARDRAGSPLAEVRAVGMIDAPPSAVWKVLRDYPRYKSSMPYTTESRVLSTEGDGKVIFFYSVIDAPLVAKRDYVIRIVDESDWQDGKGFFRATWKAVDKVEPEKKDLVRVRVSDGSWLLEPKDNGTRTWATYSLFTDPGGSIPKFIANKANSAAVPDVFKALRKHSVGKLK